MKQTRFVLLLCALLIFLAGCRNETQNRIRRDMQDWMGGKNYINVYAEDGAVVHSGTVKGMVTRAKSDVVSGAAVETSDYVYWYDASGEYFQTNMPYVYSSKPIPTTAETASGSSPQNN